MTDAEAEKLVADFGKDVADRAAQLLDKLLAMLESGVPPAEAIWSCQRGFTGWYCRGLAEAFGEVLKTNVEVQQVLSMPVGGIALSQRLYAHNSDTASRAQAIIKDHAQGLHQARALAMRLFDGYVPADTSARPLEGRAVADLPKALRELVRNPKAKSGLQDVFASAKKAAGRLKTTALKAAYSELLDDWEAGAASLALKSRLEIAVREKNRYIANRIAHTELARAYEVKKGQQIMRDDGVTVVQVLLNPAHPVRDICDLHARADLWGLGPGLYPKAQAPQPVFHPWCWCKLRTRPSISAIAAREVPGGAAAYLRGLKPEHAGQVMGSIDRAQKVLSGHRVDDVINAGVDPLYHLRRLGDVVQALDDGELSGFDVSPKKKFTPQKTAKKAAEWAVAAGLVDKADYTGVHSDVANEFNQSLAYHVDNFPELRKNQKFIGTWQRQFKLWRENKIKESIAAIVASGAMSDMGAIKVLAEYHVPTLKMNPLAFAHSWDENTYGGIAVNKTKGADADAMRNSLQYVVDIQFHPVGTNTIKSVADHEFGHQLDYLLSLSKDPEILAAYDDAKQAGIKTEVSTYAGENVKEFVAECWAEWLNNPTPRKMATRVAKIIQEKYAAFKTSP
jgi:hypothetical protein